MKINIDEKILKAFVLYSLVLILPFCASLIATVFALLSPLGHIDSSNYTPSLFETYGPDFFLFVIPILSLILAGYVVNKIVGRKSWFYCLVFGITWALISLFILKITGWKINPFFIQELSLMIFVPPCISFFLSLFTKKS